MIQSKSLITIALLLAGCGGESYEIGIADHDTGDGPRLVASSGFTGGQTEPFWVPAATSSVQADRPTETEAPVVSPDSGSSYSGPLNCEELKPCVHIMPANLDEHDKCPNVLFSVSDILALGETICLHPETDPEQRLSPVRVFELGARFGSSGECRTSSMIWARYAAKELPHPEQYRPRVCEQFIRSKYTP